MRSHLLVLALAALAAPAAAQQPVATQDTSGHRIQVDPITITATRNEKRLFSTPAPVSVVDSALIRLRAPNNAADLFRDLPGLDLTGVGPSQTRPSIRGQRGQRILLLEDGIRMNNSRRQQDFGEIPSLVDISEVTRVEVVRGPASVLYGTDAIGGVVNLVTMGPPADGPDGVHATLGYRYGSAPDQQQPSGSTYGRVGRFGFRASVQMRETSAYDAPAGTFGELTLNRDTRVHDTGISDRNLGAQLGYSISTSQQIVAKYEHYQARNAGFGFVSNSDLGVQNQPDIRITYPSQFVDRYSVGYHAAGISLPVAEKLEVTTYWQSNERLLRNDIFVPFGPPGAGVQVNTRNFTDLDTYGFRAEATKVLGRHLLTYGMDLFHDGSTNTDHNTTTLVGFGPPQTTEDSTPLVPNASYRSAGVFAQGDLNLTSRLEIIAGARYQDVRAATRPTPNASDPLVTSHDHAVVGAMNVLYRLTENLHVVASAGRGFRSPNLIERFFNGPTPEGSGFQSRNPDLKPETSLNIDLGLKYRIGGLYLEGFGFRNTVYDGIRIAPTGDSVGPFPEYQNVNVDKLRYTGLEFLGDFAVGSGLSVGGSWTHLRSRDVLDPSNPVGETYSDKLTGTLRYRVPSGRWSLEYGLRHNGEQKDVALGTSPVGPVLPSFTVHAIRGSIRILRIGPVTHTLGFSLDNLTNALFAEFANVSFLRPEPGRRLTVTWTAGF